MAYKIKKKKVTYAYLANEGEVQEFLEQSKSKRKYITQNGNSYIAFTED